MKKIKKFIINNKLVISLSFIFALLIVLIAVYNQTIYANIKESLYTNENWLSNHISLVKNSENVYEVNTTEELSIFNTVYQNVIEEKIENLKEEGNYTLTNPLIIYNPYGTSPLSYYIYYESDADDLSYTIETKDYAVFNIDLGNNSTKEYKLIGFIPEEVNTLTLSETNKDGSTQTATFSITTKAIDASKKLTREKLENQNLSNGLYAVTSNDSNIYLYDNNGILRDEIISENIEENKILFDDDYIYYPYSEKSIIKVNALGKIEEIYDLGSYTMHDLALDDNGNIIMLATDSKAGTIKDLVISLNLENGIIHRLIDMKELLNEVYKKSESDWIDLNSFTILKDDIILSSSKLNALIYVSNFHEEGEIKYIITSNEKLNNTYPSLTKISNFKEINNPSSINYQSINSNEYYLTFINSSAENTNYLYKIIINETNNSYNLSASLEIPNAKNLQILNNNNILINTNNAFMEYNSAGTLIQEFKIDNINNTFKYSP